MASSSSSDARPVGKDAEGRSSRKGGEITGLALVALSIALALAIFSFTPADLEPEADITNLVGPVGAYAADILLYIFGVGALLLIVVLFVLGGFMVIGRRPELKPSEFVGYGLFVFSGALMCHLVFAGELLLGHGAGGLVGELLGEFLTELIGVAGTYILAISSGLLALMLVTDMSLGAIVLKIGNLLRGSAEGASVGIRGALADRLDHWREAREAKREARREAREARRLAKAEARAEKKARKRRGHEEEEMDDPLDEDFAESVDEPEQDELPVIADSDDWAFGDEPLLSTDEPDVSSAASEVESEDIVEDDPVPTRSSRSDNKSADEIGPQIVESEAIARAAHRREMLARNEPLTLKVQEASDFELPSISFLNYEAPSDEVKVDRERLREMALQLEKTLKDFNVDGQVVEICPGPVITMFEFSPAPGIKLSKIANLADDLAMALAAISVRIIAPIPGKGVVGIEVPNDSRETVFLKEIVADDAFLSSKATMPMALGKGTDGGPVVADLAKMPHLLVAGATGSGKSVAVNTMIVSLLFRFSPEEVRLIMVDPKMLEFSIYEGIPHLLLPVVTDPKKAAIALRWAVDEMERRYRLLADMGVRNIKTYNKRVEVLTKQAEVDLLEGKTESDAVVKMGIDATGQPKHVSLPRIVCIVDEFADLMMVASKDVETCVARLAQKARAAGIHVILATQRPSVDVVTGLIKANFPTRIALRVAQRTDSRTILDSNGAENLLGRGDMLFLPPGSSAQQRVHGAFVSEVEIDKIVAFLKQQGEPQYDESLLNYGNEPSDNSDDEERETDEHYDKAVFIVTSERKASISMLQRKLRVGYNRAARMIEQMESDGIVSPPDGTNSREVLAPPPPPA